MTAMKAAFDNDTDVLKGRKELFFEHKPSADFRHNTLEERLTIIFLMLGFSARIRGYRYLREAVKLVTEDPSRIHSLTKNVYWVIAQNNGTKIPTVERAISYALSTSFNSGKLNKINDLFDIDVIQKNEKPTASELIALIAEKLRYEKF